MAVFRATFRDYCYYALPILVAGFTYGWENGSMGGILEMPQFLNYFGNPTAFRQGVMTAGLQAGEFGGSLIVGLLFPDRFGRRLTILAAIGIYLVGQAIVISSTTQGQFIAGRVINGFGAGAIFQTISLYTAEISPRHIRGQMTSCLNTGIAVGMLVAYWVQYGTAKIPSNAAWQVSFGLQLVPAAVLAVFMYFRPESPRWLVRHDRQEEGLEVLAYLQAGGDTGNAHVQSELQEIVVQVEFELKSTPSYFTLLFDAKYRRRTALGMGAQFLQQVSGPNIVLYYASKVFAQTGTSGTEATLLANGIGSALLLVGSLSLTIMTDVYGRRKPLILGPFVMGVCFIVVGSMLVGYGSPHYNHTTQAVEFSFPNASAGKVAIAFMFLYEFFFGAIYSSVPWTYPNEIFAVDARARGTALSTATNWFVNFWLGLYIPTALNEASWKLYFIFAGICFVISVISWLFFPETAQRSLEELDLLFLPSRTIWVFRDPQASSTAKLLEHDSDPEEVRVEMQTAYLNGLPDTKVAHE